MSITITKVQSTFEREPLIRPFGFKGGYIKEIWQTAVLLAGESRQKIGLATQNAMWSDAAVYAKHSPAAAEALMYVMSEYALQLIKGTSFVTPMQLLDDIYEKVHAYGVHVTGCPDLRKTFTLNALVAVDNAAWLLYAAENGISNFDELIPADFKAALSQHHSRVAPIPLMAYGIPVAEIVEAVKDGYFFLKIKIGRPGSQNEMLDKDKARISEIHRALQSYETPYTRNGKLSYYFDANGRYETKELLIRLLEHLDDIGALEQTVLIEEPFPEEYEEPVHDLPVRFAADESAHTEIETRKRIQLGYKAIALKPIAKTLSMSLKIARLAHEHNVPCFCADLTVNPILVDWNKNVAARLAAFPGLDDMGLLETNGHQNYADWSIMQTYHPFYGAKWMRPKQGIFATDDKFYAESGGIFAESTHYRELLGTQKDLESAR